MRKQRLIEPNSFSAQIPAIIFLTGIFFLNFTSRIIISPMMPSIQSVLKLTPNQAGSLFFMISLGFLVGMLGSGYLVNRIKHRGTIFLAIILLGFSLIPTAVVNSLWQMRVTLTVVGATAGLYQPSGITAITDLVDKRDWGKAIGLHQMAPSAALVAGPLVVVLLNDWIGWRGIVFLLGVVTILIGLVWRFFGRGGDFGAEAPNLRVLKVIMRQPAFWLVTFFASLAIGGTLGIYSLLPLYLVKEKGFSQDLANTLVGISMVSGFFMSFFSGWLMDRIGMKKTIFLVLAAAGLATILLGAAKGSWLVIMVFLQPSLGVCFFPAGFAALSHMKPPELRNITIAVSTSLAVMAGSGLAPAFIGYMGGRFSFAAGIIIVGCLILMGSILVRFLRFADDRPAAH